jgi:hypothetical protein
MDTSLVVGQEEQVAILVPRNFIHLKGKLFFVPDFVVSGVNETDQINFVPDSYGVSVWCPCDVDVLT